MMPFQLLLVFALAAALVAARFLSLERPDRVSSLRVWRGDGRHPTALRLATIVQFLLLCAVLNRAWSDYEALSEGQMAWRDGGASALLTLGLIAVCVELILAPPEQLPAGAEGDRGLRRVRLVLANRSRFFYAGMLLSAVGLLLRMW